MLHLKTLKLVRTTSQSISTSTTTAVSWSSAEVNTGPASWWSSGSPTQIVMPWAGLYYMTFHCGWSGNGTGYRLVHLNETSTIDETNRRTGSGLLPDGDTGEPGSYINYAMVVNIPTAGVVYMKTVWQNSGSTLTLANRVGQVQPASVTFSYLDG